MKKGKRHKLTKRNRIYEIQSAKAIVDENKIGVTPGKC